MKYLVTVQKVRNQKTLIEADSKQEAVMLVCEANGEDQGEPEYSCTLNDYIEIESDVIELAEYYKSADQIKI